MCGESGSLLVVQNPFPYLHKFVSFPFPYMSDASVHLYPSLDLITSVYMINPTDLLSRKFQKEMASWDEPSTLYQGYPSRDPGRQWFKLTRKIRGV